MKLTEYVHGGGCGCKIAPDLLKEILSGLKPIADMNLLVGFDQSDDAAIYKINDETAIVATTDFFTPVVDDPFTFGQIAATNAFSDVYAMGARPLFALSILGMPIDKLSAETISLVLQGGHSVCETLGVPIAGGHSIDTLEPIYGLAVIGKINPAKVKRNTGAKVGDSIILGKPLGIGVYSAAFKRNLLTEDAYREMISLTTQINITGALFGEMALVHAVTDVTGFGLLGHLKEIIVGSAVGAEISLSAIPFLEVARKLSREGIVTGASARNWSSYSGYVRYFDGLDACDLNLLTDPQTSGGLLVTCAAAIEDEVLKMFHKDGFLSAARIGQVMAEPVCIEVVS
ncbi:MAG: selenide, water dikinase SelD [Proteobacteria bacterium]|nr:selenide, water dikinase SelD [Pseudomonadota bacterium]MDA1331970.1 selenide, water dikinase SelD [Pseudomonadota bacterium]